MDQIIVQDVGDVQRVDVVEAQHLLQRGVPRGALGEEVGKQDLVRVTEDDEGQPRDARCPRVDAIPRRMGGGARRCHGLGWMRNWSDLRWEVAGGGASGAKNTFFWKCGQRTGPFTAVGKSTPEYARS